MLTRISHIGIAVNSIKEALKIYQEQLDLKVVHIEEVASEGVRVAMLPIGDSRIELLEPLGTDSPIHKFIEKHGEGVHHIAFGTSDVRCMSEQLSNSGIKMIGAPREGAEGKLITFIHPKSSHGVLIELCEEKKKF